MAFAQGPQTACSSSPKPCEPLAFLFQTSPPPTSSTMHYPGSQEPNRFTKVKIAVHQSASDLITLLDKLEQPEHPTTRQLSTEEGRLELARKAGRRDLVNELLSALNK